MSQERTGSGAPTAVGYARANAAMAALVRKAEQRAAAAGASGAAPGAWLRPAGPTRTARTRTAGGEAGRDAGEAADAGSRATSGPAARGRGGPVLGAPAFRFARRGRLRLLRHQERRSGPRRDRVRAERGPRGRRRRGGPRGAQGESAGQDGAEPEFKAATAEQRAVGQVIDLTAHDETEPVDVARLRSAIS
ncbi:hypothetical protein ACFSNO_27605 [Streptomyces cirratus]